MRTTLQLVMLMGAFALPAATVSATASPAGHDAKATAMSATGTLEKFDASSKMLTLKTAKGDQTFVLADSTRIHHGSKTATPAQLSSWDGQPVKVRFTEANGVRTASSVMVGGMHRHAAATAASAHTAAPPK